MLGTKNILIRETMEALRDPKGWNPDGAYQPGTKCIVTACFARAVHYSHPGWDCNHQSALQAIRDVIQNRFGATRLSAASLYKGRKRADIIEFNDHPLTTHDDVMSVLRQAELKTRPFWRKPLEAA